MNSLHLLEDALHARALAQPGEATFLCGDGPRHEPTRFGARGGELRARIEAAPVQPARLTVRVGSPSATRILTATSQRATLLTDDATQGHIPRAHRSASGALGRRVRGPFVRDISAGPICKQLDLRRRAPRIG